MSRIWPVGRLDALAATVAGTAPVAALRRWFRRPRPAAAPDPGVTRTVEAYAAPVGRSGRVGEWWVPTGAMVAGVPLPTVVLVHGGFWRPGFDRQLQDAVAADLANHGHLVWNVDYRSAGADWPATLADLAAAYDHLPHGAHADLVDPARIAVVGHSAGGHLALWLASRHRLPAGTSAVLTPAPGSPRPALAVSQAGVAALTRAARDGVGSGAVGALVGGSPGEFPERYAVADPMRLLPTGVRTVLIHGLSDDTVPIGISEAYVQAATGAGDDSRLVRFDGAHREHLDPASVAGTRLREALAGLPAPRAVP